MLRMAGDLSPSSVGIDFFQKSLGDPSPTSGGNTASHGGVPTAEL